MCELLMKGTCQCACTAKHVCGRCFHGDKLLNWMKHQRINHQKQFYAKLWACMHVIKIGGTKTTGL